jgi:hypothetical protein
MANASYLHNFLIKQHTPQFESHLQIVSFCSWEITIEAENFVEGAAIPVDMRATNSEAE